MSSRILNLISKVPTSWPQRTLQEIFTKGCYGYSNSFSRAHKVAQIFENAKIGSRAMFCNPEQMMATHGKALNNVEKVYLQTRKSLLSMAISTAKETLDSVRLRASDISHLVVTSEFPSCPPLDFDLAVGLNMNSVSCESLSGWGCAGGVGSLAAAHRYVTQHPFRAVMVVAAEAPSRIWATQFPIYLRELIVREEALLYSKAEDDSYLGDSAESLALHEYISDPLKISTLPAHLPGQSYDSEIIKEIVVAALVGDAVSVGIIVGNKHEFFNSNDRFPVLKQSWMQMYPGYGNLVGATQGAYGTRMYLSPEIPKFMAREFPKFLTDTGIDIKGNKNWLLHPGGPKILSNVEALGISHESLKSSWRSLHEGGNCLSVSILDVIQRNAQSRSSGPCFIFGVGPSMRMIALSGKY